MSEDTNNAFLKNPWIGLNSYVEGQPLFGRDEEIAVLLSRIQFNTQTVVYGRSGIGKSSVICAGVFPELRECNIIPVWVRFEHNDKPYIDQIKDSLFKELKKSHCTATEIVKRHCDSNGNYLFGESLWEFFHRYEFKNSDGNIISPLIVIDQFEEIFTLEKNRKKVEEFFVQLADLFNQTKPAYLVNYEETLYVESAEEEETSAVQNQSKNKISALLKKKSRHRTEFKYVEEDNFHVVLTIREDYLSYLERNTIHIPSLRHNRYCLQPINEEQAAQIIMQPCPGLVDKDTAKLIIEKVTGETDFELDGIPELSVDSAVLSLYLSRIFDKKGDEKQITPSLIKRFGDNIIEDFYTDTIEHFPVNVIEFLEDSLLNDEGHRENISVYKAKSGCSSLTDEMLKSLADDHKLIRRFSYNGIPRLEFIHDILCPIIKARKDKREQLRQQEAERIRQEEEKQKAIAEEQRKRKELEEKAAKEKAEMEADALRVRKRNRVWLLSIGFIALFVVFVLFLYFYADYKYNKQIFADCYTSYELINGWPKGVGERLTKYECEKLPLYYELSYVGLKNKKRGGTLYTDVCLKSSNKYLPEGCRIPSLEWSEQPSCKEEEQYNIILSNVKKIHFSSTKGDEFISKQELFGDRNNLLMTITYYHISENEALAQYLAPDGRNLTIRSNGIDRVKISWDSLGRTVSQRYYDNTGVQQSIVVDNDVMGYHWIYFNNNTVIRYATDEFGIPSSGITNNTIVAINAHDSTTTIFANSNQIGQSFTECPCDNGYSKVLSVGNVECFYNVDGTRKAMRTFKRSRYGDILSIVTDGDTLFGFPHIVEMKYKRGKLVYKEHFAENGRSYANNPDGICKWEYEYNLRGELTAETRTRFDKVICFQKKIIQRRGDGCEIKTVISYNEKSHIPYYEKVDTFYDDKSITTFYGRGGECINYPLVIGKDTMRVHRIVRVIRKSDSGKEVVKTIFQHNEQGIVAMPTKIVDGWYAKEYHKRTEEYDKDNNLVSLLLQDEQGTIIKSMMYFYQGGTIVGRAVKGIDGYPVRCDKWEEEGLLYYKLYYNKNYTEVYSALRAVNEFGHRSAFVVGDLYKCGESKSFKGMIADIYKPNSQTKYVANLEIQNYYSQFCLDNDEEITDIWLPYLHVLNKNCLLYIHGLKDGDRIVQFGKWHLGDSQKSLEREWNYFLDNKNSIEIIYLRCNATDYSEHSVSINNQSNADVVMSDYHVIRLTKDEYKEVVNYLKK